MDDNSKFRGRYFQALGIRIDEEHKPDASKLKAARKLAHKIRQFEIELYWKRATYFWAFQLIAFTALGLLLKDGHISPLGQLPLGRLLIPAPIGVITAFAGYLTARGSKFWQENWEAHVDLLEDETQERLTHVILCRDRPQFSVSRVNQQLLLYLTLGWLVVLVAGAFPQAADYLKERSSWLGYVALGVTVVLAFGLSICRSDFTGCAYYPGAEGWSDYPPKGPTFWQRLWQCFLSRRSHKPFIIWRDRSAKDVTVEQKPTPAASGPDNQPTPRRVS
jgi:hypothetical protein